MTVLRNRQEYLFFFLREMLFLVIKVIYIIKTQNHKGEKVPSPPSYHPKIILLTMPNSILK